MYLPPAFREDRLEIQHELMRQHPLATLVTMTATGLDANPLPFVLDADAGGKGVLRAHLARANPQWRTVDPACEALVVFAGIEHYITPSWYETKRQTGKVVPTWNYVTVHAYGALHVVDDAGWLRAQIARLTDAHEGPRPQPWGVDDAPADYVAGQLKGIVGIEIAIARIEGKWKASQNRPAPDRESVALGLAAEGTGEAAAMAALVASGG